MKQVKFARTWSDQVDPVTVHEYPGGWSGTVANDVADRASAAKALEGEPRAAAAKPKKASPSKAKPKAKTPTPPVEPAVPAPTTPAT